MGEGGADRQNDPRETLRRSESERKGKIVRGRQRDETDRDRNTKTDRQTDRD